MKGKKKEKKEKNDRIWVTSLIVSRRPPLHSDVESAKVVYIPGVGSGFSFMVG
jgi:hypothetical protein